MSTTVRPRRPPGRRLLELAVEDDGAGLPNERAPEALMPGRRLDETMPGDGFGLSSCRELAELYGGGLRLERSALGGLAVKLTLPPATRPPDRTASNLPHARRAAPPTRRSPRAARHDVIAGVQAPRSTPLDLREPRTRSRLAILAAVLAVAPPVLAFVSMFIDMQFLGGSWGGVNEMTSLFLQTMMLSVPTSFILGLVAIFRIRGNPQLTGTGLAVLAVLASAGIVAAVLYVFSQFGAHY